MRVLGSAGFTASVCAALSLLVQPSLGAGERLPGAAVLTPALALLLVLGLAARARAGNVSPFLTLGVIAVVMAVGYDAIRGQRGTLRLQTGQATRVFEEEGPGGRPLGLRPLGFDAWLERVDEGGAALGVGALARPKTLHVRRGRAASHQGFRLGAVRRAPTGDIALLRIAVSGEKGTEMAEIGPDRKATAGDLEIALDQYFADFALDEKQRPFSRSPEHRNPAALLRVRRGGEAFRVFVIRALPGVHRPEELGRSFAIAGLEPALAVEVEVAREPAAPLAGAGLLLIAAVLGRGLVQA